VRRADWLVDVGPGAGEKGGEILYSGPPTGLADIEAHSIRRLVVVDQKPIGRTPRSNMATYTGLVDHVRKLFAATKTARAPL
jgi:excinuclease ABC subunit A